MSLFDVHFIIILLIFGRVKCDLNVFSWDSLSKRMKMFFQISVYCLDERVNYGMWGRTRDDGLVWSSSQRVSLRCPCDSSCTLPAAVSRIIVTSTRAAPRYKKQSNFYIEKTQSKQQTCLRYTHLVSMATKSNLLAHTEYLRILQDRTACQSQSSTHAPPPLHVLYIYYI